MAPRSDRTHVDSHSRILSAALVMSYCAEAATLAAGTADEFAMHATTALEEVIVSARKRDESLQDIPLSVSVRSGEELDDRMDFRVQEILRSMPNVTTEVQNPRQTSIAIRGLGRSPANDGLESSVGIFVDGVYLGRPGMVITDLIDLERFEVLRGPQGTLFGKNTTAGALNVSTRMPSPEPEASIEANRGNHGFAQIKAAASGSLVADRLAFRLNAFDTNRSGFVHGDTVQKDLGEFDRHGARGQLLWTPNKSASVRVIADYSAQDEDGPGFVLVDAGTVLQNGAQRPNNFLDRSARAGYTPSIDPFARRSDADAVQRMTTEQAGVSMQVDVPMGAHRLSSISAYRKWNFRPQGDGDLTALSIFPQSGAAVRDRQVSQEIRLASPTDTPVNYVAGLYLFSQRLTSELTQIYGIDAADFMQQGLAPSALDGFEVHTHGDPRTDSHALFAQVTWRPNSFVELTGGLRWTSEDKEARITRISWGGASLAIGDAAAQSARERLGAAFLTDVESSEDFTSALLSASVHISADSMTYFSVSHGAKSGGINVAVVPAGVPQVLEPETATSYELGFKSQWLDRRLLVNVATYWTEVDDYQATLRDRSRNIGYLTNVGSVRSRGLEFESLYKPTHGLRLSLAAGWIDATYTDFRSAPCPLETPGPSCDLTGRRVVGAAPWTVTAGFNYELPIRAGSLQPFIAAEYHRSASYMFDLSEYTRVEEYGVANASLGIEAGDQRWRVTLWARNLFDADYYTTLATAGAFGSGATFGAVADPRTYGLSLRLGY
jgi:iron complex outermembrane receptor protein